MEKQKFSRPYLARFWLFRKIKGGTWYKYGYRYLMSEGKIDGWYWTQENFDYACSKIIRLKKLKEITYETKIYN